MNIFYFSQWVHNTQFFDNTINQCYANFFSDLTTSNETLRSWMLFGDVNKVHLKKNSSIKQNIKSLPTATKSLILQHFKVTINAFKNYEIRKLSKWNFI